jgi:hypothetical protein
MKNRFIFGLLLSMAACLSPAAEAVTSRVGSPDDLGVGVMMGQPFGVIAKYWLTSDLAIDGAAGYHFNHNFDTHLDYLWHSYSSFNVYDGRLPCYVGVGARVLLGNDSQLGLRLPFGVTYLFPNEPFDAFVELAPVVKLVKGIGADMDGLVGLRIYLNYLK